MNMIKRLYVLFGTSVAVFLFLFYLLVRGHKPWNKYSSDNPVYLSHGTYI